MTSPFYYWSKLLWYRWLSLESLNWPKSKAVLENMLVREIFLRDDFVIDASIATGDMSVSFKMP